MTLDTCQTLGFSVSPDDNDTVDRMPETNKPSFWGPHSYSFPFKLPRLRKIQFFFFDQSWWPFQIVSPVETAKLSDFGRSSANPQRLVVEWGVMSRLRDAFLRRGSDLKNEF